MRAVDTNVLVRLLVRDDKAQVNAAEAFIDKGAWVSHLVLAETVWVLDAVYERTSAQLATAIELLLNHQSLALQDADVVASALNAFRARPSLGFSDCLVLEIACKAGHLPLGTLDRNLAKLEGARRL
jgi:predicted nucleic-acid-binding protein